MARVRYGIIGLGRIALRQHLPVLAMLPEAEVVALCDQKSEQHIPAQEVLQRQTPFHADYREVLERDDVDVVLVATPNDTHAEIATAALLAGKHVFLEKPMATTYDEAKSLVELQATTGKVLQVGYVLRHSRFFRKVRELVAQGAVGTPRIAYLHEFRKPLPTQWRYDRRASGGVFVEKNCHHFDLFNWVLEQQPVRVAAFGSQNVIKSGMTILDNHDELLIVPQTDTPDNATVNLEFDGGAHATLLISFTAPFRHRLEMGVYGDEGLLVADQERLEIVVQGRSETNVVKVEEEEGRFEHLGSVEQHQEFMAAVQGTGPVYCDARLGLEGLIPGFLAQESLESGRIATRAALDGLDTARSFEGKHGRSDGELTSKARD